MENFLKNDLITALQDMELLSKTLNINTFDIYLLGGSGAILAGYLDRATRDFDIMELDYDSRLGRVLKLLEPFDSIDEHLAAISPTYKTRAKQLTQFKYLSIYVLSREDIIVSKIARLNDRDANDIAIMLPKADIDLIFNLAEELLSSKRTNKFKLNFYKNFSRVAKEHTNVQTYLQQLEKLRKRF